MVAGLRTLTAPAAVSWAARLGWLHLEHTPLAWLGSAVAPYIFTIAAVAELINDKLPRTPSRKEPGPFIGRVLSGAVCGAAIGWAGQGPWVGIVLGALGGVAGTLGGYELRMRLARAVGRDLPIALLEDAIAVVSALCIVSRA